MTGHGTSPPPPPRPVGHGLCLRADLTEPATRDPALCAPPLPAGAALVHAAGLLAVRPAAFAAAHRDAPRAALAALSGKAVLLSAIGTDTELTGRATACARFRQGT